MNSAKVNFILLIAILASGLMFHSQIRSTSPVMPIGKIVEIKVPLGLPPVVIPADNPPTAETIALGRRLFYDSILSSDRSVSCASCHSPQFGFADPRPFSEGVGKKTGTRHSPPVVNAAYFNVQF